VQQKSLRLYLLNLRKQKIAARRAEVEVDHGSARFEAIIDVSMCGLYSDKHKSELLLPDSKLSSHIAPDRRLGPKEDVISRQLIHTSLGKLIRFGTKPYQSAKLTPFLQLPHWSTD
jgi:hypothetical protein